MSSKKWEMKMNEARELKKQGAALLFQRVELLNEIYEDKRFLEWCETNSIVDLDYLDNEVADVAATFLTLRAVLKSYGREADWVSRNIREMIAEVLENQKRDRTSERVSWKERCLAAEKECERLRSELESMEARVTEMQELMVKMNGRQTAEA